MARRVTVLLLMLFALGAISDLGRWSLVYANYEYGCDCRFNQGGGVFIYRDDWTFVDQRTGATNWNLSGVGSGAYFCQSNCISYGLSLGGSMCSIYGAGHKIDMIGWWDYQDPFHTYGGSGNGYIDAGPYECQ